MRRQLTLLALLLLALPLLADTARIFNVKDYGAVLDGKADDAPAIRAAFTAMLVNGHPWGTLLIPGLARVGSTLDFDGGYRNVTQEEQWAKGTGETCRIVVTGALRPDAGIGTAVKLHGLRGVWTDLRFDKGGKADDVALRVEDLDLADIGVSATDFAGTVLYADASADRTKRIRTSKIRQVYASSCGRAIFWRGIEAFGTFEFVWDRNCVNGSLFQDCADTTIKYYENYSPATQQIGLHFQDCNMFSVGVISLGDRPSQALLQITGGDFGSIQRVRVSGRPDRPVADGNPVGLRLLNVKSVSIDNLQSFRCRIGLDVVGSNVVVKTHNSLTGDGTPLVVEGTPQNPKPRVDIGAWYRYHPRESVRVLDTVTGGTLHLHGILYDMNTDGKLPLYAIDCRSKALLLDVTGLTQEHGNMLTGSIFHPDPTKIRGVAQARLGNPLTHGAVTTEALPSARWCRTRANRRWCSTSRCASTPGAPPRRNSAPPPTPWPPPSPWSAPPRKPIRCNCACPLGGATASM